MKPATGQLKAKETPPDLPSTFYAWLRFSESGFRIRTDDFEKLNWLRDQICSLQMECTQPIPFGRTSFFMFYVRVPDDESLQQLREYISCTPNILAFVDPVWGSEIS